MQIAENIVKSGETIGGAFSKKITQLIRENNLKKIIETGTLYGLGTTRAIIQALKGDETVYSIECNPSHYRKAIENNKGAIVQFLLGHSIGRAQIPVDPSFDGLPDYIVVDHKERERKSKYNSEVNFPVNDHMLKYALSKMEYRPDLVILDSAGHMGFIEFKYLMKYAHAPFYLALDDIFHVKHFDTMQFIRDYEGVTFEIVWEIEGENMNAKSGEKFGSAIVKVC